MKSGFLLDRAEVGLEHHVEITRLGPGSFGATVRARNVEQAVLRLPTLLLEEGLFQVVGTKALVAAQTFGQRIGEDADMTRSHPNLFGQDHRGVKTNGVIAAGDHISPPLLLDVLFQLDAQRSVIPGRAGTAIDLTGRKTKPRRFARLTTESIADADNVTFSFSAGATRPSEAGHRCSTVVSADITRPA